MAGTNQFGGRQSGKITSTLVKADSLVPLQDRLAKANLHIPIAHGEGHGGDLVPAGFPGAYLPTHRAESLYKKGFDKMRLQLVGFDSLHILPDGHDPVNIHSILSESAFFQKLLQSLAVHGIVHNLPQSGTNLGIIAVANGFDQQIPQVAIIEGHLTQDVEYFAAKSFAFFFQLFKQTLEHHALSCFFRDQIPEMADFGLSNTVDTAKSLFQPVGIPGKVIVDHQVGTLQVDTFTSRIGSNQDAHIFVLLEKFLHFAALISEHAAVNRHNRLVAAEQVADFIG